MSCKILPEQLPIVTIIHKVGLIFDPLPMEYRLPGPILCTYTGYVNLNNPGSTWDKHALFEGSVLPVGTKLELTVEIA